MEIRWADSPNRILWILGSFRRWPKMKSAVQWWLEAVLWTRGLRTSLERRVGNRKARNSISTKTDRDLSVTAVHAIPQLHEGCLYFTAVLPYIEWRSRFSALPFTWSGQRVVTLLVSDLDIPVKIHIVKIHSVLLIYLPLKVKYGFLCVDGVVQRGVMLVAKSFDSINTFSDLGCYTLSIWEVLQGKLSMQSKSRSQLQMTDLQGCWIMQFPSQFHDILQGQGKSTRGELNMGSRERDGEIGWHVCAWNILVRVLILGEEQCSVICFENLEGHERHDLLISLYQWLSFLEVVWQAIDFRAQSLWKGATKLRVD